MKTAKIEVPKKGATVKLIGPGGEIAIAKKVGRSYFIQRPGHEHARWADHIEEYREDAAHFLKYGSLPGGKATSRW